MQPTLKRATAALLGATVLAGSLATTVAAVGPEASTTTMTIDLQGHAAQDNHPFTLTATVSPTPAGWDTGSTIAFVDADGSDVGCAAAPVDAGNQSSCTIADPAPGTYHFKAAFVGNDVLAGSESDPATGGITVDPDSVEAHAVGVSAGSIYPVKDGYRDTVTLSGHRDKSIAVTISIYNSNNKRVRIATKSSATGSYSYVWNGRNSKGDVLPAGKYRIVQKLSDTAGTTKSFTAYVNLSAKKLVTVTKTITKNGSALAAAGGKVSKSGTSVRLKGGSSAALAGWQFKIPSAVIYKWLSFRVNASARLSAPASIIAMQNFNLCGDWNTGCFDRFKGIGNSSGSAKWYSTSGSPSAHRKGLTVRGLVGVASGTVYVHKAEIKVTYQILK